ncbi:MAG: hypothetical protein K2W96_12735 [Gemmataceae bacterium]|nr:hypothetical protein [Gemmataceae bacterium]
MQWAIVAIAFVFAAGYILRGTWRSFSGSCGGSARKKPALIPASDLVARFKRRP